MTNSVDRYIFSGRCKVCNSLKGAASTEKIGDPKRCNACGSPIKVRPKDPKPEQYPPKKVEPIYPPTERAILNMSKFSFWWAELNKYFTMRRAAHLLDGIDKQSFREYYEDGDGFRKIFEIESKRANTNE